MSDITLDVGLAYKIKQALLRNGIPDVADLDWLATGGNLARVRQVRLGYATITQIEHIIDCDADPFVPDGWKVTEHQKGGQFKWNKEAQKEAFFYAEGQQNGKALEGNKLRKELAGKPVMNANVLDYLLAHPHLIPEEWKGKYVFFWGTIYRNSDGDLYVRCLYWSGDRWDWGYGWLGNDWVGVHPAALRAS